MRQRVGPSRLPFFQSALINAGADVTFQISFDIGDAGRATEDW